MCLGGVYEYLPSCPDTADAGMVLVDAPRVFQTVYAIIRPLLAENTLLKYSFASSKDDNVAFFTKLLNDADMAVALDRQIKQDAKD